MSGYSEAIFCWLREYGVMENDAPMPPCSGGLIRAHLIKEQTIHRHSLTADSWDPRVWVYACGGPMGNGGHHGMLDQSKKLRIPRDRLPRRLEEFAAEHGLTWWLDREYGPCT